MKYTPTDITRDELNDIASFSYYDGINYAKEKNLKFTTDMSLVRSGYFYMVCCGDVMVKVEKIDYPEIKRNILV